MKEGATKETSKEVRGHEMTGCFKTMFTNFINFGYLFFRRKEPLLNLSPIQWSTSLKAPRAMLAHYVKPLKAP